MFSSVTRRAMRFSLICVFVKYISVTEAGVSTKAGVVPLYQQKREQRSASPSATTEKRNYAPIIIELDNTEVVPFGSEQRGLEQDRRDRSSSMHSKGGEMKDSIGVNAMRKQALTYQDYRRVVLEGSAKARKLSSETPTTLTDSFNSSTLERANISIEALPTATASFASPTSKTKTLKRSTRGNGRLHRDRTRRIAGVKKSPRSSARAKNQPPRYSKRWKALWFTGIAAGTALVLSSLTGNLDYEFIKRVEENAGELPPGASPEDESKYNALARLSLGIYSLGVTGISYLIMRFRTRKKK